MNSQRKFLSTSFKILAVLAVFVLSLSSLFVMSVSAADAEPATIVNKTTITIVASIDTNNGSMTLGNSEIKVYKVATESQLTKDYIKAENLVTSAMTGTEGEVKLTLDSGYYIFQENEVVFNNKRYTAEPLYARLSRLTDGKKVYIKHTVTDIPTSTTVPTSQEPSTVAPTETPTTVYNEPQERLPYTGSQIIPSVIAATVLATGFAVMMASKKKEED